MSVLYEKILVSAKAGERLSERKVTLTDLGVPRYIGKLQEPSIYTCCSTSSTVLPLGQVVRCLLNTHVKALSHTHGLA